jgi:arabinogalactan oligomer/maltooligosaccharide transport system permease protein
MIERKNKKMKTAVKGIVLNIVYILLCFITLIPILYALNVSFSGKGAALSGGLSILPQDPTVENYRAILFDEPFLLWLKNSMLLSVGTILVAMVCAIPAAYAASRWHFKGRKTLLQSLLVLNAFPQVLSLFALFRVLKISGMLNSHMGLIVIYAGSMCVFAIWNMKGYFDTIPIEIEEASKIDGASDWQMIRKIIMPLARPATIVTCVMVLITVWNEYLFSTTFLLDSSTYSLAGGLYQLQSNDYSRSWPMFSAASILTSIPLILIFFKIQKYMVSGLTAGGVKG